METFAHLDRLLRAFRWSLLQVALVETFALASLCFVVLAGVGVGLCALFPEAAPVRIAVLFVGIGIVLVSVVRAAHKTFVLLRDQVGLVKHLRLAYPEVGAGLETVVRLRPVLAQDPLPFSAALLCAEAERAVARLEHLPPRPPADLAHTRRLIVATAVVVATLIAFTAAWPGEVARGVRRLTGIRAIPSWLAFPEEGVEPLVYDVRTSWVISHPDGSTTRVATGEAADILAPEGVGVEVTGSFTRPVLRGHALVVSEGKTIEVPLTVFSDDRFAFSLSDVRDGVWSLHVLTAAGTRVRENTRRRLVRIQPEPPRVVVEPRGLISLKPGDTFVVSYSVESRVGVRRVEAVVHFPFAPSRPPLRVPLKTPSPTESVVRGEIPFAWPEDPYGFAGRADLEIEALDWLAQGAGRSARIRFVLSSNMARRLAEIEEAEDLVREMVRALEDAGVAQAGGESQAPFALKGGPTAQAAEVATETEWTKVLERAKDALATVSLARTSAASSPNDLRALENAVLDLHEMVGREWASFLSLRLADLGREATRWRAVKGGTARLGARKVQEVRESLARAYQILAVLAGLEQRNILRADLASTGRVTSWRRAEVVSKARDAVAGAQDFAGTDWSRLSDAVTRCVAAVEQVEDVYRTSFSDVERFAFGEIVVAPEVSAQVKEVIEAQREVHDRTAQMAFEWKIYSDQVASGFTPDTRDLLQRIAEARRRLDRVPLERLGSREAAEVARVREDLAAIEDLIEAPDYASALEQAQGLLERTSRMALEIGDQADWLAEEGGEGVAVLTKTARILSMVVKSLREVTRSLRTWKSRTESPPTPVMRAEAANIAAVQNRVISLLDKAMEPLALRQGAWTSELLGMTTAARRNMSEATARLAEDRPAAAEVHQRQAIQDLLRLKRALDRGPLETIQRQVKEEEPVTLPASRPGPPGDELFQEVLRYRDEPRRPGTEDMVRSYYDALIR